ncbi:MAG TPA: hypothetical protein VGM56_11610, partial [Byssovorax sp.]
MTSPPQDLATDLRASLERDRALQPLRLGLTLEGLLTHADLAAFRPSAPQLALVRAADGAPLANLLTRDESAFHFGVERFTPRRPSIVIPRTGVRAGKSLISAMALLHGILTAEFRWKPVAGDGAVPDDDGLVGVRPGELVRALILTPSLTTSASSFHHLVGTMQASASLRQLLVKDPGAETLVIRRPDGHVVHVQVVAARASGLNVRSTWLAGMLFDEADFHRDENGVVNLPDNFRAARPRMLHGAQIWLPSSPWADMGPYHEMFTAAFGRPGSTLAFHSDSRSMNPSLDREAEREERERDPDNAAREWDGIPLSADSTLFFPPDAVERAIEKGRADRLAPLPGVRHYGGSDLGFRKNSSALAIARWFGGKVELAYHEELRPPKGSSLKPSAVCQAFGERCGEYGVERLQGDGHYAETAREELDACRPRVVYDDWNPSLEAKTDAFTAFRRLMHEGLLSLPDDKRLIAQIKRTQSKPMPGGRIQIQLPRQGQAHGDLLMAIVLACVQVPLGEATTAAPKVRGSRTMVK